MQPGTVFHFSSFSQDGQILESRSQKTDPWTKPEWNDIHDRHLALWAKPGAWPARTAKAKKRALDLLSKQIGEYSKLMDGKGKRSLSGGGHVTARVLLLMKSPGKPEIKHPDRMTKGDTPTGKVYQRIANDIQGSGASVWVTYVFPYHKSSYWTEGDVPQGAAAAFSFYVRATIRILRPKVVVCPSRYLSKYMRAKCTPRSIDSVPDAPTSEFVQVSINRLKFHMLRIPHPFTTSPDCSGITRDRRLENAEDLRKGLALLKTMVSVSKKPIDATALLMRGERKLLSVGQQGGGGGGGGGRSRSVAFLLPGVNEPPNFSWIKAWKGLALMDAPATKVQIAHLAQRRGIKLLVNLGPRAHPKSWFSGIGCRQIHSPVPEDEGTLSLAEAQRLSSEICQALNKTKQSVGIHRRYGSGASGTLLACALLVGKKETSAERALALARKMRPAFQPSSIQTKFVQRFEAWIGPSSVDGNDDDDNEEWHKPRRGPSPDIRSFSSSSTQEEDESEEPPKKKKRFKEPIFVVWLKHGNDHYKFEDRVFGSRSEADNFVTRGNRILKRHSEKRDRLEAQTTLLGTMKQPSVLYYLESDDVRIYEIWDTQANRLSYISYGSPTFCGGGGGDGSMQVKKSRRREGSENLSINEDSWNKFSRGLSHRPN